MVKKKIFSSLILAFVLLLTYVPILILIIYSFTDSAFVGQWKGFSLALYLRLFSDREIMLIVKDTILLALAAASISTILGTVGAIGIYYSKKRTAKAMSAISNIPMINAEIITAVSLVLLFTMFFGGKSMFSLLSGHVVITIPFVVISVIPKLKQMDDNLYEAALDLGATPLKALLTVVLPEIIPGIVSGFMLSVTLSLDDYIVTAFTKPNTFSTISTYVYESMNRPATSKLPELRALSAIIFFAILGVALLSAFRKNKRQGDSF